MIHSKCIGNSTVTSLSVLTPRLMNPTRDNYFNPASLMFWLIVLRLLSCLWAFWDVLPTRNGFCEFLWTKYVDFCTAVMSCSDNTTYLMSFLCLSTQNTSQKGECVDTWDKIRHVAGKTVTFYTFIWAPNTQIEDVHHYKSALRSRDTLNAGRFRTDAINQQPF